MRGGDRCLSFVVVGEEDSAGAELEDEGQKEEDEGDDEEDEDVDEDKDKEEVRSALG